MNCLIIWYLIVRKTYYDDADFKALGMMTKEHVLWTSKEDGIVSYYKHKHSWIDLSIWLNT